MKLPSHYWYTQSHEWVAPLATPHHYNIGITAYAQHQLGDIVYLDIQIQEGLVQAGQIIGTIESVKAVAELYAPMSGQMVASHQELVDHPEWFHQDPYQLAWILTLQTPATFQPQESLLSSQAYQALLPQK